MSKLSCVEQENIPGLARDPGMIVFKQSLLLLGGVSPIFNSKALDIVQSYNLKSRQWNADFPSLIFPVKNALATVIGRDKIVIVGACVEGALLNFDFV